MKRLFIFILASLFCVGLFAEPKIPKTDNYYSTFETVSYNDFYTYVSNSGQNVYKVFQLIDDNKYSLYFINESYLTNITISIVLKFDNELSLSNFANRINTANIEQDFIDLRQYCIESDIEPIYSVDKNRIIKVLYTCNYR